MRGLHWFRNDLRLLDNGALAALAEQVDEWLPVFVLEPRLLDLHPPTRPRTRFLLDCLLRLAEDLAKRGVPFILREGRAERVIPELARELGCARVSWNEAPTPLARRRDGQVEKALRALDIEPIVVRDHTVFGPDEIRTATGGHFAVYTPYRNAWWRTFDATPRLPMKRRVLPSAPIRPARRSGVVATPEGIARRLAVLVGRESGPAERMPAGEAAAHRRLAQFLERAVSRYATDRDRPDRDGTSRLSAHLRFGTISSRSCFALALDHARSEPSARAGVRKWLDELVWRDFYHAILAHTPHVLRRDHRPEYAALAWRSDEAEFRAWCEGRTGYPFVDAGMRQLAATGWMHNRARMVVASFLTKHLLIDWRRGARHFEALLVDADPASNSGGWQWAASTGTDAQPYFRIFNPVAQGERFDPEGTYVKQWVPELRGLPPERVHRPWHAAEPPKGYPQPIVDHVLARARALDAYRAARQVSSSARTRVSR